VFILKNIASGRCLDEPSGNTGTSVQMQVWDCNPSNNNQKYWIKVAS